MREYNNKNRKRKACLEEKLPKGIIKRGDKGDFIPYCSGRNEGIILNYRGCEKENCKNYQKLYLKNNH